MKRAILWISNWVHYWSVNFKSIERWEWNLCSSEKIFFSFLLFLSIFFLFDSFPHKPTNFITGQSSSLSSLGVETHGPDVKPFTEGLLAATAAGFLNEFNLERVNMVNALTLAKNMELHLSSKHEDYAGMVEDMICWFLLFLYCFDSKWYHFIQIHVRLTEIYKNEIVVRYTTNEHTHTYRATVFHQTARIVQIDEFYLELEPVGIILFLQNYDRPGVAALVGQHLADDNVNISSLNIGRSKVCEKNSFFFLFPFHFNFWFFLFFHFTDLWFTFISKTGHALTIVNLDSEPTQGVVDRIIGHHVCISFLSSFFFFFLKYFSQNIESGVLVRVREL
jgi:hypothetical protein